MPPYHEPGNPYPEEDFYDYMGHHETRHEDHSEPVHKNLEEDAFDMFRRILFPESHEEHPGEHTTEHLAELLKLLEELGHSEEFLDVLKEVEFYHPGFLEKLRHGHAHEYVEGLFRRHTEESFDPKQWEFDHNHPYVHHEESHGGGHFRDTYHDAAPDRYHEKYQAEKYHVGDPVADRHLWEDHHYEHYQNERPREDYPRKVPEPKSTERQSHTEDEYNKKRPTREEPMTRGGSDIKNWEHQAMHDHPWSDSHDSHPWMAADKEHVRNVPEGSRSVGVVEDEGDDEPQGQSSSEYIDRHPRSTWNAALPPAPSTAVRYKQTSTDIIYPGNAVIENGATLKQSTVVIFIGIVFAIIALVRKFRTLPAAEDKYPSFGRV